jgi:hypothetical protein
MMGAATTWEGLSNIPTEITFGHKLVVPTVISGFVPAYQQYRSTNRIEDIERPERPSSTLSPKFAHGSMTGTFYFRYRCTPGASRPVCTTYSS